jgi:hypothetical protein
VIAAHRNGAADMGGLASVHLPAGNWLISATLSVEWATASEVTTGCSLVAGASSSSATVDPLVNNPGVLEPVVLLLAHHFGSPGTAWLSCGGGGTAGEVLARDVHLIATKVGKMTVNGKAIGSGAPAAVYSLNNSFRSYAGSGQVTVQHISVPAGTWLVQAAMNADHGFGGTFEVRCSIQGGSNTADQGVTDLQEVRRSIGLEGFVTLSSPGTIALGCNASAWNVDSSAMSAMKVGKVSVESFGGSLSSSGSGTPVVVEGYSDDPGGVPTGGTRQSIAKLPVGSGSWVVVGKLSVLTSAAATVDCRLNAAGRTDEAVVQMDTSHELINSMFMAVTRSAPTPLDPGLACDQSAGSNQVVYFHDRIVALKVGSLTDTLLE